MLTRTMSLNTKYSNITGALGAHRVIFIVCILHVPNAFGPVRRRRSDTDFSLEASWTERGYDPALCDRPEGATGQHEVCQEQDFAAWKQAQDGVAAGVGTCGTDWFIASTDSDSQIRF
jgi:hypothetical protein